MGIEKIMKTLDRIKLLEQESKRLSESKLMKEIFGFSQSEKDLKMLKQKVDKAKKELAQHNIAETLVFTIENPTTKNLNDIREIRINICKKDFPTVVELLPHYFKPGLPEAHFKYLYRGNEYTGWVPITLQKFVATNNVIDTNKYVEQANEKFEEQLDNLLIQFENRKK